METTAIEQATNKLMKPSEAFLHTQKPTNEISIYAKGKPLTANSASLICNRLIKVAFPNLNEEFFVILTQRLIANNFTEERFIASVNHVIDTFTYGKSPNTANFINFDSTIKLLNKDEMLNYIDKVDREAMAKGKYILVEHNNKKLWASKEDAEMYQLKKVSVK